jgi:hypothetical protein
MPEKFPAERLVLAREHVEIVISRSARELMKHTLFLLDEESEGSGGRGLVGAGTTFETARSSSGERWKLLALDWETKNIIGRKV